MTHITIIGGGITGLSAAWELEKESIPYTVLEASGHWGGKVITRVLDSGNGSRFIVDGGPESFVTRKPEVWNLALELGIQDEVMNPGTETRDIYVLDGGRAHPIPLSPLEFLGSPLLTWQGKMRMLAEPLQPARRDGSDESLADFVTRRLGHEALEKFIGPVLGGIYNTDPERQSILVSSPIMRELEAEAGSLALAAIKRMLRGQQPGENPPPSRFITFKNGAQMLVDALVKGLKGDLKLNARVTGLTRDGGGYQVVLSNGETVYAHKVIFATLANVTAEILRAYFPEASENLGEIPHNHIGTISLVYRKHDLPSVPVINGLMIPRREGRAIDAVTFTSRKMPSRGSAGYELIRVFLGGGQPEVVEMGDEELIRVVRGELAALLGITASPLQISIFRWKEGFPQAEVGHLDLVDEIERILPEDLAIAGSSYRGIAVPDCIRQGREAAKKLVHP